MELSHSENPEIKNWLMLGLPVSGYKEQPNQRVSMFLLDLAIRNVKGKITSHEVGQQLKEHYGETRYMKILNLDLMEDMKSYLPILQD